jgi:hypothetical protein
MPALLNATSIAMLVFVAPWCGAQELPALLHSVDESRAQQLIDYNSPWLQAELYSAKRFRVVLVDTDVLMRDDDFAVTLFDDTAPLHLTQDSVRRYEEAFAWSALSRGELPEALKAFGARQTVLFSGVAWDTDDAGRAMESSENRFDLRKRNKRAFYSVSADFQLLVPGTRYRLAPLKYTPKYSVLFELDPDRLVPIAVDRPVEGERITRTPAELARLRDYDTFIRNLPPDRNLPVVDELN